MKWHRCNGGWEVWTTSEWEENLILWKWLSKNTEWGYETSIETGLQDGTGDVDFR